MSFNLLSVGIHGVVSGEAYEDAKKINELTFGTYFGNSNVDGGLLNLANKINDGESKVWGMYLEKAFTHFNRMMMLPLKEVKVIYGFGRIVAKAPEGLGNLRKVYSERVFEEGSLAGIPRRELTKDYLNGLRD